VNAPPFLLLSQSKLHPPTNDREVADGEPVTRKGEIGRKDRCDRNRVSAKKKSKEKKKYEKKYNAT
jgi:hypothetical protein